MIDKEKCRRIDSPSVSDIETDRQIINFIVKRKLRKASGERFLGPIWLIMDPLIYSLIYLFVFTVLRAKVDPGSIFIGVTLYGVFSASLSSGIESISEINGGLKCERVSTPVLVKADFTYRLVDIIFRTAPTSFVLVLGFGVVPSGALCYLFVAQIMGHLVMGLGFYISPFIARIDDIKSLIKYALRIGFYASPTMIPMSRMAEFPLLYRINQYNPFTYFVELIREFSEFPSEFSNLSQPTFTVILLFLFVTTFFGTRWLDDLRWRMTAWS